MHIEDIIGRFQGAKKIGLKSYQCHCPVHNDSKASLTVTEEDNKILLHCHAGCETLDILRAVGLNEKDLFNNQQKEKQNRISKFNFFLHEQLPIFLFFREFFCFCY